MKNIDHATDKAFNLGGLSNPIPRLMDVEKHMWGASG